MEYFVKSFSELSTKEFFEIVKLRVAVFVVEQNCPYQEVDDEDETALHTWLQEGQEIVGYTRIMDQGETTVMGRVIVSPKYRGKELGKKLVNNSLRVIEEMFSNKDLVIGAQAYLLRFYQDFGFEVISDVYLEDDIPHVKMKKSFKK